MPLLVEERIINAASPWLHTQSSAAVSCAPNTGGTCTLWEIPGGQRKGKSISPWHPLLREVEKDPLPEAFRGPW